MTPDTTDDLSRARSIGPACALIIKCSSEPCFYRGVADGAPVWGAAGSEAKQFSSHAEADMEISIVAKFYEPVDIGLIAEKIAVAGPIAKARGETS